MHVALRGPTELLGSVQARNAAPAIRVVNLAAVGLTVCPWLVALLFPIADDDGSLNMGKRSTFTMLAQLSPIAGNSLSRELTPLGSGEQILGCQRGRKSWCFVDEDILERGSYRAPRPNRVN